jgi:hypothetical protein
MARGWDGWVANGENPNGTTMVNGNGVQKAEGVGCNRTYFMGGTDGPRWNQLNPMPQGFVMFPTITVVKNVQDVQRKSSRRINRTGE